VKGTVITLADGTTKLVEDIDYNDILRVWNFDEGKIDESPILWKMRKHVSSIYWKITLEDGTVLKLVGSKNKSHRLFNIQQGKFIYPQDFNDGEQTYKEDGSIIKLLSAEKIEEEVKPKKNGIGEYKDQLENKLVSGYSVDRKAAKSFVNNLEIKELPKRNSSVSLDKSGLDLQASIIT
jgi:hypothetical protein